MEFSPRQPKEESHMEEKNYDYSNKKSYNGVAPKENEALVPFLAHEVLKNYHQDIRDGIRKRKKKGFPAANRTQ